MEFGGSSHPRRIISGIAGLIRDAGFGHIREEKGSTATLDTEFREYFHSHNSNIALTKSTLNTQKRLTTLEFLIFIES